jgi:hypothetical protein
MPLENTGNTQDGQAGAASTGTTTGSSTTAETSPHQPSGAQAGTGTAASAASGQNGQQAGQQAAQAGQGNGRTAAEDRSNWHPPHVNRRLSREVAEYRRQAEQARQQLAALTGIQPPQNTGRRLPQGVTEEQVSQALQELDVIVPGIGKLVENGRLDKLIQFLDSGMESVTQQQQQYYRSQGAQTIRALESEVQEQIGQLTQRGMGKLVTAFYAQLQNDEEFFERWQQGDPRLITEFVNEYKSDVLDPYHTSRASSAAGTVARARTLPRGGNTSAIVPGQSQEPPLDPNDPDAVHKRAFARMQARQRANTPAA